MLLDKLAAVEARYEELEALLADPEVTQDYSRVAEIAKERSAIEEVVQAYREYKKLAADLESAEALRDEGDPDMREMAQAEIDDLQERIPAMLERLKLMLLPKDPRDGKNVIMEIRAGAGGDELACSPTNCCACTPAMLKIAAGKWR